jgi:hypothetical protein
VVEIVMVENTDVLRVTYTSDEAFEPRMERDRHGGRHNEIKAGSTR